MKRLGGVAVALYLAGVLMTTPVDAALYWGGASGITRVNADGSLSTQEFIRTGDGSICGIAVDNSHVYWTDSSSDTLGRASLDGANVEDDFISPAGGVPCGVAVDGQYLYWADRGGEAIGRARLDGSHVEMDFIEAPENPCAVAVSSNAIYWSSETEGVIRRTDIGGLHGPEVVVSGATTPCGLIVDRSHLFWTNGDLGTVSRANLDGAEVLRNFIVGGEFSSAIALDESHLYWVNAGWGLESIGRANLDGTGVDQNFLDGLRYPYALAVDDMWINPASDPPRVLSSGFEIGRVKRNRGTGVVHVSVDLPAHGVLRAAVVGRNAKLSPRVLEDGRSLDAGRTWLEVRSISSRGRNCDGHTARLITATLFLGFTEPGKEQVGRKRMLRLRSSSRRCRAHLRHRSR